tara:strand:- start:2662 stop:3594 length:933 start_codon:yes stop_codon:yes gene_type:complete
MENKNELQGLDKAAILFQVLGEALALSMFQNISDADIMRIRIRSRELQNIPVAMKKNILEEYYFKMMSKQYHSMSSSEDQLFSFLHKLNDEQMFYLINTEPPKVIALALDQLNDNRKMKLLDRFDASIKHNIIMELGNLNEIPLEGVVNVAQELKNKVSFLPGPKEFTRGGAKSIATILNQMGGDEAQRYLEQISTDDPELYLAIKKHFLSFDDLLEMPEHIMRVYWRNPEIDVDELAKACKGYDESVIENILINLPKRKQKMYEEYTQPISKKDLEKSQALFVSLAKNMNADGEINLEDLLSSEDDMIE